ncbi:MAG: hypothetical protein CL607_18520 [Anaerolineaceae bacterium]|nr:hypothetical protein [Anaerolineaceae bacterium]
MKAKPVITLALLAFVALSVITLVVNQLEGNAASEASDISDLQTLEDRLVVYYFLGTARCYTCRLIESHTRDIVEATYADQLMRGQIEFRVINVETRDTVHFIEDYRLSSPSVVLARFANNVQAEWKNLDRVWQFVGSESTFRTYIQDEITAMMQGSL